MAGLDCLLADVDLFDPLGIVDLRVDLLLAAALRLDPAEIGRAPHLVGVELVGALVLVAIGVRVHAVVEGVSRLETQFPIEVVPVEVSHEEEAITRLVHFSLYLLL